MNPSDWIYHLNMRAVLDENGFLDPCARARPGRATVRRPQRARRAAVAGLALASLLLVTAAAFLGR